MAVFYAFGAIEIDARVTVGVTAGPGRTVWFLGFFTDKVYAMRVPYPRRP